MVLLIEADQRIEGELEQQQDDRAEAEEIEQEIDEVVVLVGKAALLLCDMIPLKQTR